MIKSKPASIKGPSRSNSKGHDSDRNRPVVKEVSKPVSRDPEKDRHTNKESKESLLQSKSREPARAQASSLEKMKAERLGNDVYKNLIQVCIHKSDPYKFEDEIL